MLLVLLHAATFFGLHILWERWFSAWLTKGKATKYKAKLPVRGEPTWEKIQD